MSKSIFFICSKCDSQFPKWSGRCLECGSWGTLKETSANPKESKKSQIKNITAYAAGQVVKLGGSVLIKADRFKSAYNEFDRVLGGGLVKGSLVLLGGDPGVGKSTLALQLVNNLAKDSACLYVSAEESLDQISQRLARLKPVSNNLGFLSETKIETIIATINQEKPNLVVVDSIQTIFSEEVSSEAGSLNQVKACTAKLLEICKKLNITVIIIGQVTKQGQVAGPKATEHLVDTVLYLEGDKYKQYRLLRAAKNRFGSVDEVGVWQMASAGLTEVKNPSQVFLSDQSSAKPGSVIVPVVEGSRIFLVEVQALVSKTTASYPKRTASGFESRRLEVLTAVLIKRAGLNLNNFDVVVNIAGGLNLREPALDLAVCTAIISAWQDKPLNPKTAVFGEVGLAGELKTVLKTKERLQQAIKLGFSQVILPSFKGTVKNINLVKISELKEVLQLFK